MSTRPQRHLRAGDLVGIVAPSGPAAPGQVERVPALLARHGLRARLFPGCHAAHPRHDFLAASDAQRTADLHAAFADADVQAVWCLRGGHGSLRLLPGIDAVVLQAAAHKPFVGYSDATALHALRDRAGLPGWHAPMPASDLLDDAARDDADALFGTLMQPLPRGTVLAPALAADTWHVPGVARGRLVGGNLCLLAALQGTPWAPDLGGALLFVEDVDEPPYRVDRLLLQLRLAGALDAAAGFVVGRFSGAADAGEVLREHLHATGKPVLAGWPAGHGRPNRALPLGVNATLDAATGTLVIDEDVLQ